MSGGGRVEGAVPPPALKPQRSILCSWLLEIHLEWMASQCPMQGGSSSTATTSTKTGTTGGGFHSAWRALRQLLKRGVASGDLERGMALHLIASHGLSLPYLYYVNLIGEHCRVVEHYCSEGKWKHAILSIGRAPLGGAEAAALEAQEMGFSEEEEGEGGSEDVDDDDDDDDDDSPGEERKKRKERKVNLHQHHLPLHHSSSRQELWYKYSPLIFPMAPTAVIKGWRRCPGLDACRLLPTLVRYATSFAAPYSLAVKNAAAGFLTGGDVGAGGLLDPTLDAALLYLEGVVESGKARGAKFTPLHNFLLTLYVHAPVPDGEGEGEWESEGELLAYVKRHTEFLPPSSTTHGNGKGYLYGLASSLDVSPTVAILEKAEAAAAAAAAAAAVAAEEGATEEGEESPDTPPFDLAFALRTCLPAKKMKTCTYLYTALGLHVEAVEAALEAGDVPLAKWAANALPSASGETRDLGKRLWTKIACHVISENGLARMVKEEGKQHEEAAGGSVAQAALAILKESDCLRVEDILVYFPGSTRLEDFKGEVSASLAEADSTIRSLREEMKGHADAAERIRGDIKALRGRHVAVNPGQKCALSNLFLLTSNSFYVFPCGHAFIAEYLVQEMLPHLSDAQRKRLGELLGNIGRVRNALSQLQERGQSAMEGLAPILHQLIPVPSKTHPLASASIDELKEALMGKIAALQSIHDDIVASECCLCGDVLVNTIDEPLDEDDDQTWDL